MDFKDLLAYKKAFDLSMKIFDVSKSFLKEEKYSLTDQIRRSSRSVCANISEAYRKRRYPKHFILKIDRFSGFWRQLFFSLPRQNFQNIAVVTF